MYRLTVSTGASESTRTVDHYLYNTHQAAHAHLQRIVKDNNLGKMPGKCYAGGRGEKAMRAFVKKYPR